MSAKSVLLEPQHLLDPTLEHTLIVVKPDGYARGLTGEILRRIEANGADATAAVAALTDMLESATQQPSSSKETM